MPQFFGTQTARAGECELHRGGERRGAVDYRPACQPRAGAFRTAPARPPRRVGYAGATAARTPRIVADLDPEAIGDLRANRRGVAGQRIRGRVSRRTPSVAIHAAPAGIASPITETEKLSLRDSGRHRPHSARISNLHRFAAIADCGFDFVPCSDQGESPARF